MPLSTASRISNAGTTAPSGRISILTATRGAARQDLHLHAPGRHAIDPVAHLLQQFEVDRGRRHGGLYANLDGRRRGLRQRSVEKKNDTCECSYARGKPMT